MFEVHDYIKSYLGETRDAHNFAKQFLEKRQKLRPPSQHQVGAQSSNYCFSTVRTLRLISKLLMFAHREVRNPPSLGFRTSAHLYIVHAL